MGYVQRLRARDSSGCELRRHGVYTVVLARAHSQESLKIRQQFTVYHCSKSPCACGAIACVYCRGFLIDEATMYDRDTDITSVRKWKVPGPLDNHHTMCPSLATSMSRAESRIRCSINPLLDHKDDTWLGHWIHVSLFIPPPCLPI